MRDFKESSGGPVKACCFFWKLQKQRHQPNSSLSGSSLAFCQKQSFQAVLALARFILEAYVMTCNLCRYSARIFFLAFGKLWSLELHRALVYMLSGGFSSLGTFSGAALTTLFVPRGCRQKLKVDVCRFGRYTRFQAAKSSWSLRQKASLFLPVPSFPSDAECVYIRHQRNAESSDSCGS